MNILVTGSSGFIARFLIHELASKGHSIVGIDKKKGEVRFGDYFKFVHGNILDEAKVKEAVRGVEMIIHLAAKHHDFGIEEKDYFDVNETGTRNLLACCEDNDVKNFIFYSTVAVYGNQSIPSHEEMMSGPESPYGCSKLAAEKAICKWARKDNDRRGVIFRPTVVFGPNNFANMYNLINQVCRRRFFFVGDGSNIKSVAYVENLVEATRFMLDRMEPGVQIFNYSDEPQMTTREIVEVISRFANVPISRINVPLPLALGFGTIFDNLGKLTGYNFPITGARIKKFCTETHHRADKIRSIGFQPPVTLEEGFRKTVLWYRGREKERILGVTH